jgi:hypothetical protein
MRAGKVKTTKLFTVYIPERLIKDSADDNDEIAQ